MLKKHTFTKFLQDIVDLGYGYTKYSFYNKKARPAGRGCSSKRKSGLQLSARLKNIL